MRIDGLAIALTCTIGGCGSSVKPPVSPPASTPFCSTQSANDPPAPCCVVGAGACQGAQGGMGGGGAVVVP